ncbi:MAG: (2Fe-2S)-binding protein [Roseibacillus sp.]|nr:(2Fe-2S)-binding protein [Roseibacillus sp.]
MISPSVQPAGVRNSPLCLGGELVCHCHQVTEAEIHAAISGTGATSLEEISLRTKAGSGCMSCHCKLNRMLCGLSPNCGRFGLCGQCDCAEALCACNAA